MVQVSSQVREVWARMGTSGSPPQGVPALQEPGLGGLKNKHYLISNFTITTHEPNPATPANIAHIRIGTTPTDFSLSNTTRKIIMSRRSAANIIRIRKSAEI